MMRTRSTAGDVVSDVNFQNNNIFGNNQNNRVWTCRRNQTAGEFPKRLQVYAEAWCKHSEHTAVNDMQNIIIRFSVQTVLTERCNFIAMSGYRHDMLSVICPSSVTRAYCDKTTEVSG